MVRTPDPAALGFVVAVASTPCSSSPTSLPDLRPDSPAQP
jgi:hypothetical protein